MRPERPSLGDIVRRANRPSLGDIVNKPKGPSDRERAARARAREATNQAEKEALNTPSTTAVNFLDAASFGGFGLATDALSKGTFQANRDVRRSIYESMPASERVALGIAGGLLNPLRVPGLGAGGGMMKAAGRGALQGAVAGGAQGFGENVGTTEGAMAPTRAGVIGGALAGGILGAGAEKGAQMFDEAVNPLIRFVPEDLPGGTPTSRWRATERAARRAVGEEVKVREEDAALGYEVPVLPSGTGMPTPLAVDVSGPTGVARARKAASTPGGRSVFEGAFAARDAQMASAVTEGAPDAVTMGHTLREVRAKQADIDSDIAIEATKGTPLDNEFVDALIESPTGKAAWRMEQQSRPDLVLGTGDAKRALPTIMRTVEEPRSPHALFEPTENPFGPKTEEVTRPDAEAVHSIIRRLNSWASGEKGQVFPEGVDAISASRALGLLKRTRGVMPEEYQTFIDNYAENSKPIDALETGRTPWRANPPPANKRAQRVAIKNVETRAAKMSPELLELLATGKQSDLASRVNEGRLTPASAAMAANRPRGLLSREMDLAGGPMRERLGAWNNVLTRQADMLPTSPSRMPAGERSAAESAERAVSPSLWWSLTKGVRNKLHERNLRIEDITNTAYTKLMTNTPAQVDQIIESLARAKEVGAPKSVSRTAGIVAGRDSTSRRGLLNP